jgi:hypothetical protein
MFFEEYKIEYGINQAQEGRHAYSKKLISTIFESRRDDI